MTCSRRCSRSSRSSRSMPAATCRFEPWRERRGRAARARACPEPRAGMITALTVGIDALSITLVLALAAFGLAIIFGLIGDQSRPRRHADARRLLHVGDDLGGRAVPSAVAIAALGVGVIGLALEHFVIRFSTTDRSRHCPYLGLSDHDRAHQDRLRHRLPQRHQPLPLAFQFGPVDAGLSHGGSRISARADRRHRFRPLSHHPGDQDPRAAAEQGNGEPARARHRPHLQARVYQRGADRRASRGRSSA